MTKLLSELLFTEAMVTAGQAASQGLALRIIDDEYVVLFKPDALQEFVKTPTVDVAMKTIVGWLHASPSSCEAREVTLVWSNKGYGPLLYEIAMSEWGWLMSDRSEVSSQARTVWEKFFAREDIEKVPVAVDCQQVDYMDEPESLMNFRYRLKDPPSFVGLTTNGNKAVESTGLSEYEVGNLLVDWGIDTFNKAIGN